jgi:biopolymer transport protein ExbB/biopolymer transport protein TolQ
MSLPLTSLIAGSLGMAEIWAKASFVVKFIVLVMLVMGLASIYVSIERWVSFRKARNASQALGAELSEAFQKGDLQAALAACENEEYKQSYLGNVLRPGLVEMQSGVTRNNVAASMRAMERQAILEEASLNQGMSILATTGSTAPFVGLVGTVFGIIHTFEAFGDGGAELIGIISEIGEALYATAVGIAVAIVGVWLYNFFNGKIDAISRDISVSVQEFNDWCEKKLNAE